VQALEAISLESSRTSPPPDFLHEDDPFANHSSARPLPLHHSTPTSPTHSRRTSVKHPRSPLAAKNVLLHCHTTHFLHPRPYRVPGHLRVPLECLIRPHLHPSVADHFAQHTRDQHLHRGRRSRPCIAWHSLTSFTRLKYVNFQSYFFGD
jgi:hypothetical protein